MMQLYTRRRAGRTTSSSALSLVATAVRPAVPGPDAVRRCSRNGIGALGPTLFTADDAAAGQRRRPAQRHLRQPGDDRDRRSLVGTPIGILAGTFLAEYGRDSRLGEVVRFINDILLCAPSIIIGLFVYELWSCRMGHFSGWAGAIALAIIVMPVVVRTTEDMLQLVPERAARGRGGAGRAELEDRSSRSPTARRCRAC